MVDFREVFGNWIISSGFWLTCSSDLNPYDFIYEEM